MLNPNCFRRCIIANMEKYNTVLLMGLSDRDEDVCHCFRRKCTCLPSINLRPSYPNATPTKSIIKAIEAVLGRNSRTWSQADRAFLKNNHIDCRIPTKIFTSKLPCMGSLWVNFAMPTIARGKAFLFQYKVAGPGHFIGMLFFVSFAFLLMIFIV